MNNSTKVAMAIISALAAVCAVYLVSVTTNWGLTVTSATPLKLTIPTPESSSGRIPLDLECRIDNTAVEPGYRCHVTGGVPAGGPATADVVYRMAYTLGAATRTPPENAPPVDWTGRREGVATWTIPQSAATSPVPSETTLGVYVDIDSAVTPEPAGGPYHGYIQYDTLKIEKPTPTPTPQPTFAYSYGVRDDDPTTTDAPPGLGTGNPGSLVLEFAPTAGALRAYVMLPGGWIVTHIYTRVGSARSSSDLLGTTWNRLVTDSQVWESENLGAVTLHLEFVIARGI